MCIFLGYTIWLHSLLILRFSCPWNSLENVCDVTPLLVEYRIDLTLPNLFFIMGFFHGRKHLIIPFSCQIHNWLKQTESFEEFPFSDDVLK